MCVPSEVRPWWAKAEISWIQANIPFLILKCLLEIWWKTPALKSEEVALSKPSAYGTKWWPFTSLDATPLLARNLWVSRVLFNECGSWEKFLAPFFRSQRKPCLSAELMHHRLADLSLRTQRRQRCNQTRGWSLGIQGRPKLSYLWLQCLECLELSILTQTLRSFCDWEPLRGVMTRLLGATFIRNRWEILNNHVHFNNRGNSRPAKNILQGDAPLIDFGFFPFQGVDDLLDKSTVENRK